MTQKTPEETFDDMMMGNVECTNCGAQASSKCPFCRTIFPLNQVLTMAEHFITLPEPDEHVQQVIIRLHTKALNSDGGGVATTQQQYNQLKWIVDQGPSLLCRHKWAFKKGEKSEIDCGHKYSRLK